MLTLLDGNALDFEAGFLASLAPWCDFISAVCCVLYEFLSAGNFHKNSAWVPLIIPFVPVPNHSLVSCRGGRSTSAH